MKIQSTKPICDYCFTPAKYTAQLAETAGWHLCLKHLEIYEWAVVDLKLVS